MGISVLLAKFIHIRKPQQFLELHFPTIFASTLEKDWAAPFLEHEKLARGVSTFWDS